LKTTRVCRTDCAAYRNALHFGVIIGFRHKGLETLYRTGSARGVQAAHAPKLGRILAALEVTDDAQRLGMSRTTLSRVINGWAGISPDLALRLERAGVSTAQFWMTPQANYELALATRRKQPKVQPLQDAA